MWLLQLSGQPWHASPLLLAPLTRTGPLRHFAQAVTIVQRSFRARDPAEEMEDMGFGQLKLVATIPVYMSGARLGSSLPWLQIVLSRNG